MTRKIIGITANKRSSADYGGIHQAYVFHAYVDAVTNAGGIPVLLPITDVTHIPTYVAMVDKIILTGGQHVEPSLYGEENQSQTQDFSMERDVFELAVIQEAIKQQKPLFGVCRGLQLMNVALGGTLEQNVAEHWQEEIFAIKTHTIEIAKESVLASIYGQRASINSYHHHGIKQLASSLTVIARSSEDGIIEAVEQLEDSFRFLGVQWHPELLAAHSQEDAALFSYVVNEL